MSRKFKITPSESRNLLVPDVSRMIERYVNREIDRIYDLAEKIYEVIVPVIMNEELVRKELIIEKYVDIYIENFGLNFGELLEKRKDIIDEFGTAFYDEYNTTDRFLKFTFRKLCEDDEDEMRRNIDVLIFHFWTNLAQEEGYLPPNTHLSIVFDELENKAGRGTQK